jgi:GNAT superfamily N-acetyltransferase
VKVLGRTDSDNVIFGAFVQNQLVGVIGIFREDKIKVHHKGNIWGMYVDGPYRRKGIARKLLDTAIAHAKDPIQCLASI